MQSFLFAATSVDAGDAGWGRLVALLVAAGLFWAGVTVHQRVVKSRPDHSPAEGREVPSGAKPQITGGGGTTSGTTPGSGSGSSSAVDVWVRSQVGKRRTMDIVREAGRRFGASRRTVMRAITRAKGGSGK